MHTRRPERMSRKTLRGPHIGLISLPIEQPLDAPQFCKIPHRRGSSMRINIFHRLLPIMRIGIVHGQFHASFSTHSRRRDHVVPVRIGTVSHELRVNLRAARLGVLELLQDDDPPAAGDAEPVAALVEGPTGLLGRVVVRRGQCAHAVEHAGEVPVDVLARSAECHVGFVEEDLLVSRPDAMRAGTACGRDGEAHALHLECRGQYRADGRSHGPRDAEGTDLVLPSSPVLDGGDGLDNVGDGRSSLPEDGAHPWILLIVLGSHSRISNGILHGNISVLGIGPHETQMGLGNEFLEVGVRQAGSAADVGFDAEVGPFLVEFDARFAVVEGFFDVFEVVSEAGGDAHAGDYDAAVVHEEGGGGG
mmetsp:Transcript_24466/g.42857  ORF Transcript_24466/g.42857 Transcript_24466/m.42857 type:complete len:362 (+) Transcript_24466:399-1484(+)